MGVSKQEYSRYKGLRDSFMLDLVKKYSYITLSDLEWMFRLKASYIRKLLKEMDSKIEIKEKPSKEENTELRGFYVKKLYYEWVFKLFEMGHGYESFNEIFGIENERDAFLFHIEALQFRVSYMQAEGRQVLAENKELNIKLNEAIAENTRLKATPPVKVKEVAVENSEKLQKLASEYKKLKTKYEELLSHADLGTNEALNKEVEELKHTNVLLHSGQEELKNRLKASTTKNTQLMEERAALKATTKELTNSIEELTQEKLTLSAREKALNSLLSEREEELKEIKSSHNSLLAEKENLESLYKNTLGRIRELEGLLETSTITNENLEYSFTQEKTKNEILEFKLNSSEEEIKELKEHTATTQPRLTSEEKEVILWWWETHGKKLTTSSYNEFIRTTGISVTQQGFRYVVAEWPKRKRKEAKKAKAKGSGSVNKKNTIKPKSGKVLR